MTHRVLRKNIAGTETAEVMRWVFKQVEQEKSDHFTVKLSANEVEVIFHHNSTGIEKDPKFYGPNAIMDWSPRIDFDS